MIGKMLGLLGGCVAIGCAPGVSSAATFQVLYTFGSAPNDALSPYDGLIADSAGNLYGTSYDGGIDSEGAVFELTPPAAGQTAWTEQVLYSFQASGSKVDGLRPTAGLVMQNGVLYGVCSAGGTGSGAGVVFRLTPPLKTGRPWVETLLHSFQISQIDGNSPYGGLAIDASGILYGTTAFGGSTANSNGSGGYGVLFSLTPPAGGTGRWAEKVLHNFGAGGDEATGLFKDLILAPNGVLYGTSENSKNSGDGTVFQATPQPPGQRAWTESVIKDLNANGVNGDDPLAAVTIDANGVLYGTTFLDGVAFSLAPPTGTQHAWTETVLYRFPQSYEGPEGSVLLQNGMLYGTLGGGAHKAVGTVYQLTPPPSGTGMWQETVLYTFAKTNGGGSGPVGNLVAGPAGSIIGVTENGGASGGGEVYSVTP